MGFESYLIIGVLVVGLIVAGLYFLNRWATQKVGDQQKLVDKNKQQATIYVIDKKRDYAKNINLPKIVKDSLPKPYRFIKMYFVQAKIGPQIMTFMCEKKVFQVLPEKKNVKVELAGIYIVSVKGMKTEAQLKQIKKEKKEKLKEEKKQTKAANKNEKSK